MKKERSSIKEINAEMDKINKRKPTKIQIEELGKIIKKINEANQSHELEEIPMSKIASSHNNLEKEIND